MLKWVFLALWILCTSAFVIGQLTAPPNYANTPSGDAWGSLFGTTVVLGGLFFLITIALFVFQKRTSKAEEKNKPKYNLSLKRIVSRLSLTFVLGILFGLAMFPFMRNASGLLYEQRAAIGTTNIIKMIAFWGLFTLIFLLFTLWKKRFRMTSVFLIVCWIISIGFFLSFKMVDKNVYRCERPDPYANPQEFNRALDLIAQRIGIDDKTKGTVIQSAYNFRNCINIQYLESNSQESNKDVSAYFLFEKNSDLQNLKIYVDPYFKNFDDLTLATILVHELVHVGQFVNEKTIDLKVECYESEAQAYWVELQFFSLLNQEEQRSIVTRMKEDIEKNPIFTTFLLTNQRLVESQKACLVLKNENKLTDTQVNECISLGVRNKVTQDLREDPLYQKQCSSN